MSMTWWVRITYTDTPFSSGLNVLDNASDRWKQDDEILVEPPLSSLTVEPFFLLWTCVLRVEKKNDVSEDSCTALMGGSGSEHVSVERSLKRKTRWALGPGSRQCQATSFVMDSFVAFAAGK